MYKTRFHYPATQTILCRTSFGPQTTSNNVLTTKFTMILNIMRDAGSNCMTPLPVPNYIPRNLLALVTKTRLSQRWEMGRSMFWTIPYPLRISMHQPLSSELYAFRTSRNTWNRGSCDIPANYYAKFASKVALPIPLPSLNPCSTFCRVTLRFSQ